MEIVRPFSSSIGRTYVTEEHETILKGPMEFHTANATSLISTDRRFLQNFPILKQVLLNRFYDFLDESEMYYQNEYVISTSWIARVEPGQYSSQHFHKNCFYSGIYYFEDEYSSKCGNLIIQSPIQQLKDFNLHPTQFNEYNSDDWTFVPESKRLIFFPSYLSHVVTENKSNRIRHSLAFNIIPIGEYGNGDSTYNTDWVK